MNPIRFLLFPFSVLYGTLTSVRNFLFDVGIFPSKKFDLKVISVGNIRMGGTGKSPHIEYLIRLLKNNYAVATLSRGHGRSTSGFKIAGLNAQAADIGDEPLQFYKKFENIQVAVDNSRVHGIKMLQRLAHKIEVVLLDDAHQHRQITPGLSIVLTTYDRLYINDYIFPVGSLRESVRSAKRADIIIVSKCPDKFSPMERRILTDRLKIMPYQKIVFSRYLYGSLQPLTVNNEHRYPLKYYAAENYEILLITGLASAEKLIDELNLYNFKIRHLEYNDHHRYSSSDIQKVQKIFNNIATTNKIILTTEKDAMRLVSPELADLIKVLPLYYIPIKVDFLGDDASIFDKQIIEYVKDNQIDSKLHKR